MRARDSLPTEEVWVQTLPQGARAWLVIHLDEGKWFAERFVARRGRMQRREWSHEFVNRAQALGAMQRFIGDAKRVAVDSLQDSTLAPTERPGQVIWTATNEWNDEWEAKYSAWVKDNLHPRFYVEHNIATDCADVAISSRWIFARINKLPVAQSLAATGALFTNESMRDEWANLPTNDDWNRDRRFRAALDYVLDNTYTHSLFRDSYPIKISLQTLTPGSHHLSLGSSSGHTLLVSQVDPQAELPLRVTASTVPRAVRELHESGYWYTEQPHESDGGFLRIRWAFKQGNTWRLKPGREMTTYSKEQYQPEFMGETTDFGEAVLVHISPELDYRKRLKDGIENLKSSIAARVQVVHDGYAYCSSHDCSEGTAAYEDWSTPSRDKHLVDLVAQLRSLVARIRRTKPEVVSAWTDALVQPSVDFDGVSYRLEAVVGTVERGSLDSDPRSPEAQRWRLAGEPVATWLGELTGALLKDREARIGQAVETFEGDRRLRALSSEAGRYCRISPEADCEGFNATLANFTFTAGGRTLGARPWLKRAPFMASDATQSDAYLWGDHADRFEAAEFGSQVIMSRQRRAVVGNFWRQLDEETWQDLRLLPGASIGSPHLNTQSSLMFGRNYTGNGRYSVLDADLKLLGQLPSELSYGRWASPTIMSAELYKQGRYYLHFFRAESDHLTALGHFEDVDCYASTLCGATVASSPQEIDLFDLSAPTVAPLRVRFPDGIALTGSHYGSGNIMTKSVYIGRAFDAAANRDLILSIRKTDGVVRDLVPEHSFREILPSGDALWLLARNAGSQVSILQVTDDGQLLSMVENRGRRVYVGSCYQRGTGWVVRQSDNTYAYLYPDQDRITALNLPAGNEPVGTCGAAVLTKTSAGMHRIYSVRSTAADHLVAEAPQLWISENDWFAQQRPGRPEIVDLYHVANGSAEFVGWTDGSLLSAPEASWEAFGERSLAVGGGFSLKSGDVFWLNEKL